MEKRQYIQRKWVMTKQKWANYARQHSCFLLQCMITNAVESWHASFKKHADGEIDLMRSDELIVTCLIVNVKNRKKKQKSIEIIKQIR